MTLTQKTVKLLEYSLVLKSADKQLWSDLLPKMNEKQTQTLYQVLVDEVRAWKKEGISVIPDLAVELSLLPESSHGTSVNALKDRLEGKIPPAQIPKPISNKPATPNTPFGKELQREVTTPELEPPTADSIADMDRKAPIEHEEMVFGEIKAKPLNPDDNAWMVSDQVVVPKIPLGVIKPQPLNVPKIRNRVAKHGLKNLADINGPDDLEKIEPAHLRQGPLWEQINTIKTAIINLAHQNDMLPISLMPVFEKSPLFQTYLRAGMLLIEKNQGDDRVVFDQVIGELDAEGLDSISQPEFEAVADLKKDLEVIAGV